MNILASRVTNACLYVAFGLSFSLLCGGAAAAEASTSRVGSVPTAISGTTPSEVLKAMTPSTFLQAVALRNLEVSFGRQSIAVADAVFRAESALYEPLLFSSYRVSSLERQRTPEETASNVLSPFASETLIDEIGRTTEVGVRQRAPTGAEVSISVREIGRRSNLLAKANTTLESRAFLVLNIKQPLLKGFGSDVTEADKKVAELEASAAEWQYIQQLHKVSSDALVVYWQANAAQETLRWRELLLKTTDELIRDSNQRVLAGKLAPRAELDLRRVRATREVDVVRARQTRDELFTRLLSTLDLDAANLSHLSLQADEVPIQLDDGRRNESLARWAPFRISQVRKKQGEIRLAYARNQRLPGMDVLLSYGQSGLGDKVGAGAWPIARSGAYPEWSAGVNFEIGALGNQKAKNQWLAQKHRVEQATVEMNAIRQTFLNDLFVKQIAVENIRKERALIIEEVTTRKLLLDDERKRFEAGMGLLSFFLQAQQDFTESNIRLVEARGREESAKIAFMLASGALLPTHGIDTRLPQDP